MNNGGTTGIAIGIGAVSVISGNPANFLAMAKWMQFISLFTFAPFKKYPKMLMDFYVSQGIFSFDFVGPMWGVKDKY